MADFSLNQFLGAIQVKYRDMGDGSHALIISTNNPDMQFDDVAGGLKIIDTVHDEVHEGEMFEASYMSPDGAPIADNANLDVMLVVGAGVEAHMTLKASAGGAAELRVFRGITTSNDGTGLAEINMNGTSLNVAASTAFHTPTVSDNGTQMFEEYIEGGTGGNASGGNTRDEVERVFAAETKTLIRLTNRAGNAKPMSIHIQWYEE